MLTQSLTPTVTVINGVPKTTTLDVAKIFGKQHYNVIRDINNIKCSQEFRALNFEGSSYKTQQGKVMPMYNMTKDGFVFLAFGFTGEKADQFKEAYIKRFNEMESTLKHQALDSFDDIHLEICLCKKRDKVRPSLESKPRLLNHIMSAAELIRIVIDAINLGTYKYTYEIQYLNNLPTLSVNLKNVLMFLHDKEVLHAFHSHRQLYAELKADGLINPHPRYTHLKIIDLSKFLGDIQ